MDEIEKAAIEYGDMVSPHSTWTAKNAATSFKAGVEYMKQYLEWVGVEDSLPPIGEKVETLTMMYDGTASYQYDYIDCMEIDDETYYEYPVWFEGHPDYWRKVFNP
jgi:hypothetical protein